MTSSQRILAGLVAGTLFGLAVARWLPGQLGAVNAVANVVGGLWLNALRMTVLPLVFALLVNGVLSAAAAAGAARFSRRAITVFGGLYLFCAAFGTVCMLALLAVMPIPEAARAALAGGAIDQPPELASASEMILGLIPVNVVEAAASGALLPIVVFAILLGAALARMPEDERRPLANVLQALSRAMFVIIHWVLAVAPVGVFALMAPVAGTTGLGALNGLAHYMLCVCVVYAGVTLSAYPVARQFGRIGIGAFARAILPAQLVAMSTRSSLASLPAMIESADALKIPPSVSSVSLPVAVSMFRAGGPASAMAVTLYGAAIYGVAAPAWLLLPVILLSILTEFGGAGVPNQATFFASYAPIAAALGVPIEFLAIVIAVDAIPDTLLTAANVSMDLAATTAIAAAKDSGG